SPEPYDVQVLGQPRLLAGSAASLRIRLIDRSTGAALAKVPVEIELRDPHSGQLAHLARFDTDADGTGQPQLQLPDWADGDYELRVTAKPAGDTETIQRTIKLERSWKLMLSSDKPVYQPGQEIHVRAMTLSRPDFKPVAWHDVVFT